MSLESYLKDADLVKRLDSVKKYAKENLLRFWQIHAHHFVDHGETHSSSIDALLERIITKPIIDKMTQHEIFLLSCGVWLHDIGMTFKEEGETDKDVRDKHHIKSKILIRTALPEIPLSDDERYMAGEIAFYHRKAEDINKACEIFETQIESTLSKIRVRFLCSLLRLADGCEIATSRSSRKIVQINELDDEAKFHHEAHLHVSAIDFDSISSEIIVSARVKDQTDALVLENFLKADLEKELITVKEVLRIYGVYYTTVKPIITIDSFAEAMPKPLITKNPLALNEKLVEFEKKTGYYPSMVIEVQTLTHIFYETISQTAKELQREVIAVSAVACDLFSNKERVFITMKKMHDFTGTVAPIEPEIVTIIVSVKDYNDFKANQDRTAFWNSMQFFRRPTSDKYFNNKVRIDWRLIP